MIWLRSPASVDPPECGNSRYDPSPKIRLGRRSWHYRTGYALGFAEAYAKGYRQGRSARRRFGRRAVRWW